jgi:hypothetical protein
MGGYMTASAVTRTDRFRAASMGAGISNLISMMTTHDIPDFMAAHIGLEVPHSDPRLRRIFRSQPRRERRLLFTSAPERPPETPRREPQ